mmetsp:Transcript_27165/g.82395  ORF Transcript_27165/g.82395 Transcript_27165/m.82395 type:complete len:119 (+) Transcript_27165:84-440(+)
MADAVKQLKIKTGAVRRCMKDRTASDREIEKQQQRIESFKSNPEKDEHDVAKQEEVLAEMVAGRADELVRLKDFMQELESIVELTKGDLGSSDEYSQAQEAMEEATALLKKEGIPLDD